MKNLGLIPVKNFGVLDYEKGIYRSAQPLYEYEYKWLQEMLGIKTVVNLRGESTHDDKFAGKLGINVIDINIPDHYPPTLQQSEDFIKMIQEEDRFPMLFHCAHGHGRTSTFSVLAKIALGWSLESAIEHEREEFHYQFKHSAQTDFLRANYAD